ncbi:MAG: type II toxin-antitoxin system ParD family antitoxin [Flavobacteriales bacterium]|nr:type II toxin-antitoxin system ParD family antitoxin [Flavobacteriales bacterium]
MSKNTSISLGSHFENFIEKKISSGRFASVSEVVRTALRLLEDEEQKLQILRNALEEGEKSGFVEDYDADTHLQQLRDRLK